MEPQLIDSTAALGKFLEDLGEIHGKPPRLYMDLEGNNLSRNGTLSLITILLEPEKKVYLIDVTTLGKDAFTTADANNNTLKTILESPDIIKAFFDIRNDSDALYSLYGIRVAGIEDLQLMELASRNFSKRVVNGLAKCIEQDTTIGFAEKKQWRTVKEKGKSLYAPERGGSYAVFDQRPLSDDMIKYCAQDVLLMPHLRKIYRDKLCDAWWAKIETETHARIQLSRSPGYNGKGRHMALAPIAWQSWNPSPSERLLRTFLQDDTTVRNIGQGTSQPPRRPDPLNSQAQHGTHIASYSCNEDDEDDEDMDDDRLSSFGGFCGEDDSEDARDYTACDKECGYCGHCDY